MKPLLRYLLRYFLIMRSFGINIGLAWQFSGILFTMIFIWWLKGRWGGRVSASLGWNAWIRLWYSGSNYTLIFSLVIGGLLCRYFLISSSFTTRSYGASLIQLWKVRSYSLIGSAGFSLKRMDRSIINVVTRTILLADFRLNWFSRVFGVVLIMA